MDFELTEAEKMVQTTARDFAEKEIEPIADEMDMGNLDNPAEKVDLGEKYPFELWKKAGELGLIGVYVPAEYGGVGGTFKQWVIIIEEIARASASFASVLDTSWGLAGEAIYSWGNEEQKKKYLPPLIRGKEIAYFGLTEPNAGSEVANPETTYRREDDTIVLNGTKIFITNADVADYGVIFATRNRALRHRGVAAIIVEKDAPGFSIGQIYHKLGIRAAHNCEIVLQDCRVPAENLMAEGRGIPCALSTLDGARASIGGIAVGIARAALEKSIRYTKERVQYGRAIAQFQNTQFTLADMATEIDAARLLVYRAADVRDKGRSYTVEAAKAKVFASEVAMRAAIKGVQMWGGYGYMLDSPMQRYMRDAKITEIYEGTSEMMRLIIGMSLIT